MNVVYCTLCPWTTQGDKLEELNIALKEHQDIMHGKDRTKNIQSDLNYRVWR